MATMIGRRWVAAYVLFPLVLSPDNRTFDEPTNDMSAHDRPTGELMQRIMDIAAYIAADYAAADDEGGDHA